MRSVSGAPLAYINARFASEPVLEVELYWDDGTFSLFSDKKIGSVGGCLLEVSPIKSVLRAENAQAQQVEITIDDSDLSLKTKLDANNVHKRKCVIKQTFDTGGAKTGSFVLFEGVISTPFTWNEMERSITLSATSQIESFEVGFSPEEGQLAFVADEAVGHPWPLAFGHVVHVPATKVTGEKEVRLLERVCLPDFLLYVKLENLSLQYQQAAFLFAFYATVAKLAVQLAPPPWWVLEQYVIIIITEDQVLFHKNRIKAEQVQLKKRAQQEPKNRLVRDLIKLRVDDLKALAIITKQVSARKKWLEEQINLIKFAKGVQKDAIGKATQARDRMWQLQVEYIKTEIELCRQLACYKPCVRVDGAELAGYEEGVPVDVCIDNIRFRVQFDHGDGTMCILTRPIAKYTELAVDTWIPDPLDEACASGINMFWLNADPAPNLEGMYLLVRKNGGTCNHIIQVNYQRNRQVFFDLVEWDQDGTGGVRGVSLDGIINEIVEAPLIRTPLGQVIPQEALTGRADPKIWNRPETQMFLSILSLIGNPVSKQEKRNLALLVYLLKFSASANMFFAIATPRVEDVYTILGYQVNHVVAASGAPLTEWVDWIYGNCPAREEVPHSFYWEADSGTLVTDCEDTEQHYIVNLLPSTIKAVHAYRYVEGEGDVFTPVPSSYYTKREAVDMGSYTITVLTFPRSLSTIAGEQWKDEVYVTFNSSVGPNVVDIVEWLLETYTDVPVNASNFATIKAKMTNYPANFALFTRPNVLAEVERICWESRLALLLVSGEWQLVYLSEEVTEHDTLTEADIDLESGLTISYSSTDDLVTRFIVTFDKTYKPLEPDEKQTKVVLRHNVKQYGLQSRDEHFHIYNDWGLVEKSATFWLIRLANSWKRVNVSTFLTKIRTETFDTLLLDLTTQHVSLSDVKCLVEEATYDPSSNLMLFTLNTGIKTGELVQYEHFWPALGSGDFPTEIEITQGYAGGEGPAAGVIGEL